MFKSYLKSLILLFMLVNVKLMGIELDNLYHAGVVSKKEYMNAKLILSHEHEIEEEKETSTKDSNGLL